MRVERFERRMRDRAKRGETWDDGGIGRHSRLRIEPLSRRMGNCLRDALKVGELFTDNAEPNAIRRFAEV
jgi:hypothetical protein